MKTKRFSLLGSILIFLFTNTFAANIDITSIKCICGQGNTGSIEINITENTDSYSLEWRGPNGFTSSEQDLHNLTIPGDYTLIYTNSVGCEFVQEPIRVDHCEAPRRVEMNVFAICEDGGTGSILCNPIGMPLEEFSFMWSNSATTQNLEGVPAGIYSVTISYGGEQSCKIIETAEIVDAYDPDYQSELVALVDCVCGDEPVQAFTLNVEGQNLPYTFQWEGPGGVIATEQSPMITYAGDYLVTITDNFGCESQAAIEILPCSEMMTTISVTPSCTGINNGELTATVVGTYPPFTYLWSTGETMSTISGLSAGQYQLTVTDDKGCEDFTTVNVPESSPVTLSNDFDVVNCLGSGQGFIVPEITNGLGPFTYTWSNGANTSSIGNLNAGNYDLSITDYYGCITPFNFQLVDGNIPVVEEKIIHANCNTPTGSISLDYFHPFGYEILWSNGESNVNMITGLSPGLYRVTITDYSGCSLVESYNVLQEDALPGYWNGVEVSNINPANASGDCSGSIELSLVGDNGPYTIFLEEEGIVIATYENVSGTLLLDNLCPDRVQYNINVLDANGCRWADQAYIPLCSFPVVLIDLQRSQNNTSNDGSITVGVENETVAVSYQWSNGSSGATINNLAPGAYTVTVTDENDCESRATFDLDVCYTEVYVPDDETDGEIFVGYEENFEDFEVRLTGGLFLEGEETSTITVYVRKEGESLFEIADPVEYQITWMYGATIYENGENPAVFNYPTPEDLFKSITVNVSNSCITKTVYHRLMTCDIDFDYYLSEFFIDDFQLPCAGLFDGQIIIEVPGLVDNNVQIGIDGIFYNYSNVTGSAFQVLENLSPGTYSFSINIENDCLFEFDFNLSEQQPNRTFLGGNIEEETCTNALNCNGINIGEETTAAVRQYQDATSFPCAVPLKCDPNYTFGPKPIETRQMRGAEAIAFLDAIEGQNLTSAWSASQISFSRNRILSRGRNWPCTKLRMCMADLNVTFLGVATLYSGSVPFSDGCTLISCDGFFGGDDSYVTCTSESNNLVAGLIPGFEGPVYSCGVVVENFGRLKREMEADIDNHDLFPEEFWNNSELLLLLQAHSEQEINCATIRYCDTDFSILSTDLEEIECSSIHFDSGYFDEDGYEITQVCQPFILGEQIGDEILFYPDNLVGTEVVLCGTPIEYQDFTYNYGENYQPNIRLDYDGIYNIPLQTPPVNYQKIDRGYENETLAGISYYSSEEGVIVPKGIVKSGANKMFYDFDHQGSVAHKFILNRDIIHIYDDWQDDKTILIEKMSNISYLLEHQSSENYWTATITSNNEETEITNLSVDEDKITLVGVTNGGIISVDENSLFASQEEFVFLLQFDLNANLINHQIISGVNKDDMMVKVTDDEISIWVENSENTIGINGAAIAISDNEKWSNFVFSKDQGISFRKEDGLLSNNDFFFQEYAKTENGARKAYALSNSGSTNSNPILFSHINDGVEISQGFNLSSPIGSSTPQSIVVLNDIGEIRWTQEIQLSDESDKNISLGFNDLDELFISVTFASTITLSDSSYTSMGEKDIAIFKMSDSGDLLWSKHYGTSGNEESSDIIVANKGVYLAGTFSGPAEFRLIGDNIFHNKLDNTNKVFITHLLDEDQYLPFQQSLPELDNLANGEKTQNNPALIKVYPNPFKNEVIIEFHANSEGLAIIQLFDILGKELLRKDANTTIGFNTISLNVPSELNTRMLNLVVNFNTEQNPLHARLIQNK